jgi:hypothetical protein
LGIKETVKKIKIQTKPEKEYALAALSPRKYLSTEAQLGMSQPNTQKKVFQRFT